MHVFFLTESSGAAGCAAPLYLTDYKQLFLKAPLAAAADIRRPAAGQTDCP